MRTAVYTGTRNLYQYMIAAAKSLLTHSNVEQIYFLIEDDNFPYELPPKITTINISNQTYFKKDGPNYGSEFTYMALIRVALAKILTEDKVLSLDVDTIVNENISDLWDIDISDYYFAAAKQPTKCTPNYMDINAGVMLINLKKLREDKKDDEIIDYINNNYEIFPEQNAIGKLCQGYLLEIPADYNYNDSTDYKHARSRKISHFAGVHEWQKYQIFKKYMNIPNDKLEYNKQDKIGLDIIIPSYNDEKGLRRTLKSLYYPELDWINIIIVDDASSNPINYNKILQDYPSISYIQLDENKGPGNARRVGMLNTDNRYLMFVDCGDIILSKFCLLAVKHQLDNNRTVDIYEWSWIDGATNYVNGGEEPSTPGKIYRREFLESNNIYPYNEGAGSYAAEDCGINITSYAIIEDYKDVEDTSHICYFELPIYKTVVNKNSLTFKDNNEFWYTAVPGIVDNGIYCINLCEQAQVHLEIILAKMNIFMIDLYTYFLRCVSKRKHLLEGHWREIRRFYLTTYKKYNDCPKNDTFQTVCFSKKRKMLYKYYERPNLKRFIRELELNENVPSYYLTKM